MANEKRGDPKGARTPGGKPPSRGRSRPPLTVELSAEPVAKGPPEPVPPPPGPGPDPDPVPAPEPAPAPDPEPGTPGDNRVTTASPPPMPAPKVEADRAKPRDRGHRAGASSVVAVIAAGVVLIGLAVAAYTGVLGPPLAGQADVTQLASSLTALQDQVAALQSRIENGAERDVKELDATVKELDARQLETLARVERLEAAPPQAGGGAGAAEVARLTADLAALDQRIGKLEAALAGFEDASALTARFGERFAVIEGSLRDLSARLDSLASRPPPTDSERTARAVAIGVLRQAAERGGAFAADLAMLEALGTDAAELDLLRPLAEKGAPSKTELAAEFPAIADAVLAATFAARGEADGSFLDRLLGLGRGLVSVRPTSPIPGSTPEAIVSRMQGAVDQGNLAQALAEREALPAEGKTASSAWAAAATDRVAIDQLVDKLVQSAASPVGAG